jgi:hypothetical protein
VKLFWTNATECSRRPELRWQWNTPKTCGPKTLRWNRRFERGMHLYWHEIYVAFASVTLGNEHLQSPRNQYHENQGRQAFTIKKCCSLSSPYVNWCFGGPYHLHLQVRKSAKQETSVQQVATQVHTNYKCYIPEDGNIQTVHYFLGDPPTSNSNKPDSL